MTGFLRHSSATVEELGAAFSTDPDPPAPRLFKQMKALPPLEEPQGLPLPDLEVPQNLPPEDKPLSTGAKVGIGVGVGAVALFALSKVFGR